MNGERQRGERFYLLPELLRHSRSNPERELFWQFHLGTSLALLCPTTSDAAPLEARCFTRLGESLLISPN